MPLPPTQKQLDYLARLGHTGPAPATRAEASRLIDHLKGERCPDYQPQHVTENWMERLHRWLFGE